MHIVKTRESELQQTTPIRKWCSECGGKNTIGFKNFRWGKNKEMISTVCSGCLGRLPN